MRRGGSVPLAGALLAVLLAALLAAPAGAIPPESGTQMRGMDVSVYQGDVDFRAAKESGIQVVYIRAGYGDDGADPYLRQHYEGASAAGLKVGFYYYMDAESPAQARRQARRFAALVRDLPADCRPVMDYETFGDLSPSEVSAVAAAFLEETAALLGQSPMVYTGAYAAGARFAPETGAWPLWAADYGSDEPVVEANWAAWTGWQYSDQGQVPGVRGRVDLDLFTSGALLGEGEARPGGESFSYTVRRGDTLWGIARRYHTTVGDLARRNRVADPSLIYPGQVLQIPYTGTETAETYTVERGDTLWGIAREHGTTVEALAERNQLADPDLIYPGQVLRLPG